MFGKMSGLGMSGLGMSGLGMGMGGQGGNPLAGLLDSSPSPLGTGPTVREFANVVAKGGGPGQGAGAPEMGGAQGMAGLFGGQGGQQGIQGLLGGDRMQQFQTLMRLFGGM